MRNFFMAPPTISVLFSHNGADLNTAVQAVCFIVGLQVLRVEM